MAKKLIRLIYDLGTPARLIGKVLNVFEEEVEKELEEYENVLHVIEKDYYENEFPKVQKQLKEFKSEFSDKQQFEMRRKFLLQQIQEAKKEPNSPRVQKLKLEVKIFTGLMKGISPDQVLKAREYQITNLVKATRGMALCPFHPDKSPSMNIRNNFYFCHSCGATGDVIDFVMKTKNLSFKGAVTFLT